MLGLLDIPLAVRVRSAGSRAEELPAAATSGSGRATSPRPLEAEVEQRTAALGPAVAMPDKGSVCEPAGWPRYEAMHAFASRNTSDATRTHGGKLSTICLSL